jgi:hypothetical protein
MEITGIWLIKNHAHLGNQVQILIETGVGTGWKLLHSEIISDGPISHIFEEGAMSQAEVKTI